MFQNKNEKHLGDILAGDDADDNDRYAQMDPEEKQPHRGSLEIEQDSIGGSRRKGCSKSCCLLSSCLLCCMLSVLIVVLIVWYQVVPSVAEKQAGYLSMEILNGSISDVKESSFGLTQYLKISNAGMFPASMDAADAELIGSDGTKLGEMKMPAISMKANVDTILSVKFDLQITNKTALRSNMQLLLRGKAQTWKLHMPKASLTATLPAGIHYKTTLEVFKPIVMQGLELQAMTASNLLILRADENHVYATADIDFSLKSNIAFTLSQSTLLVYNKDNVMIGSSKMDKADLVPGHNTLKAVPMRISKTSLNKGAIEEFMSNYVQGNSQLLIMRGPTSGALSGALKCNVHVPGYLGRQMVFGGVMTSASALGWNGVHGAYSAVNNPLDVGINITRMDGELRFEKPISFSVDMIPHVKKIDCYPKGTNRLGRVMTGPGIFKDQPKKTWFWVGARSHRSIFTISRPPIGEPGNGGKCKTLDGTLDFSCCFALKPIAVICRDNPGLKHSLKSQVMKSYIDASVTSKMTVKFDNKFEVDVKYDAASVPLFFGYQVYGGYASNLELSCKRFTIHR